MLATVTDLMTAEGYQVHFRVHLVLWSLLSLVIGHYCGFKWYTALAASHALGFLAAMAPLYLTLLGDAIELVGVPVWR